MATSCRFPRSPERSRSPASPRTPARRPGSPTSPRRCVWRSKALAEVRGELNRIDRFQFDKAYKATVLFSHARERSKTTVIKAIHAVRRAQNAMHLRTAANGGTDARWKSCLLNVDEFTRYLDDPPSFSELIEERVELHGRLSNLNPPFIVDGTVPDVDTWEARASTADALSPGDTMQGIAGCPGVARGRARVVLDPGEPGDLGPGDVLIAPITDRRGRRCSSPPKPWSSTWAPR